MADRNKIKALMVETGAGYAPANNRDGSAMDPPEQIDSPAPGYRKATGSRACSNCVHFNPNTKADTGYCDKYRFIAAADMVCDGYDPASKQEGAEPKHWRGEMDETLIYCGDSRYAVKHLGDNKIGGYLVLFGDPEHADLSPMRDYFTKSTDFDLAKGEKTTLYYNHGADPKLGKTKIGIGSMKMDDVGVWVEAQLEARDKYVRKVVELVEAGKLGWSSGTAPHLTDRKAAGNGTNEIIKWPLGLDASLTPTPADYRNQAVALKSLAGIVPTFDQLCESVKSDGEQEVKAKWSTSFINDLPDSSFLYIAPGGEKDDEGKTKPRSLRYFPYKDDEGKVDVPHLRNALARIPQSDLDDDVKDKALAKAKKIAKANGIEVSDDSKKGLVADELAKQQKLGAYGVWNALCSVVADIAEAADGAAEIGADFDIAGKVREAVGEYADILTPVLVEQIEEYITADADYDFFYIKTGVVPMNRFIGPDGKEQDKLPFAKHSDAVLLMARDMNAEAEAVVKALTRLIERRKEIDSHPDRRARSVKAGRVLSRQNAERIRTHMDALKELMGKMDEVHAAMAGMLADAGIDMGDKDKGETKSDIETDPAILYAYFQAQSALLP